MKFAEIFLTNQSFTPIKGDNKAFSLLFQMNIIFERYVAKLLEDCSFVENLSTAMKSKYSLLKSESDKRRILIEPDYKFEIKNKVVIGDAKWKLIEKDNNDMKISPNDIYQIYSYLHYFKSDVGYIFTPKLYYSDNDKKVKLDKYIFQEYENIKTNKKLYIYYVDLNALANADSSLQLKSDQ